VRLEIAGEGKYSQLAMPRISTLDRTGTKTNFKKNTHIASPSRPPPDAHQCAGCCMGQPAPFDMYVLFNASREGDTARENDDDWAVRDRTARIDTS
jgi:hypothetical protein